jgi:dihydrofolate reductase
MLLWIPWPGWPSLSAMPRLSLIVAMTEKRVIGVENRLPWRIPADLRKFKEVTLGRPIIMGRKTYDSIGRPLPGRRNIVVSRDPGLRIEGAEVVHSLEAALRLAAEHEDGEIFVIGGSSLFAEALPLADRLYVTWVKQDIAGDTYFPAWDAADFRVVAREPLEDPIPCEFVVYEQVSKA